jgi:hypothetical protein
VTVPGWRAAECDATDAVLKKRVFVLETARSDDSGSGGRERSRPPLLA